MAKRKKQLEPRNKTPEIEYRENDLQIIYGDIVNVAIRPDVAAFTIYCSIPDPLTDDPKQTVRYAKGVVQMPTQIAIQLPTLILDHLAGLDNIPDAVLESIINWANDIAEKTNQKLEEQRAGN